MVYAACFDSLGFLRYYGSFSACFFWGGVELGVYGFRESLLSFPSLSVTVLSDGQVFVTGTTD